MYKKSPETPFTTKENTSAQDFAEHFSFARHLRVVSGIAGAALALSSVGGYYSVDVAINRDREQSATIELNNRAEASLLDPSPSAFTVYVDGYGSMNANLFADKLGPLTETITNGPYYSANFGDAPIDTSLLADEVLSTAQDTHYDFVSFNGFSAGGLLAIETAEKTIQNTNLRVDALFLTSSPSSVESLRPDRIEQLWWLNTAAKLPGAKYSSAMRWLISMVSDVDQYATGDPADFFKVWGENASELQRRAEPGVAQLDDQALAIINANVPESLRTIGSLRGEKQMPVIIYLAAEDPSADTSVNTDKAANDTCSAAAEAGLTCLVYKVPNVVHSVYHLDVASYAGVLEDAQEEIQSAIAKERTYYELFNPVNGASPLFPLQ